MHRIGLLVGLLGFALASLLISAPAMAWKFHEASHVTVVAPDEHHHHGDASDPHAADVPGEPPAGDENDGGGHDHLPSLSAGLNAIPATDPVMAGPISGTLQLTVTLVRTLTGEAAPPRERPPRAE